MHLFGLPLLLLLLLICHLQTSLAFNLTPLFPPNITWINSLDTREKLLAYLASDHRMARQSVTLHGETLVMGNNTNFTAQDCLQLFLRVKRTHFLQLVIGSGTDFQRAYHLLKHFNHSRLGISANIEKGPNCKCAANVPSTVPYVRRSLILRYLTVWPPEVHLAFGFASFPGPINQYTQWQMQWMYHGVATFENTLHSRYVIEFDAIFLGNKYNLLENLRKIKQHRWLVVIHAPYMSYAIDVPALRNAIYFLGPRFVYLNMPREMQALLAIQEGNPNGVVGGNRVVAVMELMLFTILIRYLLV